MKRPSVRTHKKAGFRRTPSLGCGQSSTQQRRKC